MIAEPVEFVCTDRGRHKTRRLDAVVPVRPRVDLPPEARRDRDTPEVRRGWGVEGSQTRVEVDAGGRPVRSVKRRGGSRVETDRKGRPVLLLSACPSCGHERRLSESVLVRLAAQVPPGPDGRVVVDVSLLPGRLT